MSFTVVKVEPTGTRQSTVLAKMAGGGCKWMTVDVPVYPNEARANELYETRLGRVPGAAYTGLRDAARILGLTPEQLSGLEHQRYTFADPADWDRAIALLKESP